MHTFSVSLELTTWIHLLYVMETCCGRYIALYIFSYLSSYSSTTLNSLVSCSRCALGIRTTTCPAAAAILQLCASVPLKLFWGCEVETTFKVHHLHSSLHIRTEKIKTKKFSSTFLMARQRITLCVCRGECVCLVGILCKVLNQSRVYIHIGLVPPKMFRKCRRLNV